MSAATQIPWADGCWDHPPVRQRETDGGSLVVEAGGGSDAWQRTFYGFDHDSAHALLVPAETPAGYEVTFRVDYHGLYDQVGIMMRVDAQHWIKSGVEISDGIAQVGAVVTDVRGSDWSAAPVPSWAGRDVTIRASLARGAVILRARADDEPWQFLRLAPLPLGDLYVGPYLCAPQGPGLTTAFSRFTVGDADEQLHLQDAVEQVHPQED
jgi:regulation of enolase protein 1 (concanavalin A-like superfamily)